MPLPHENIQTFAGLVSLLFQPALRATEQIAIEHNRQSLIITLTKKMPHKDNYIIWTTIPYTVALDMQDEEISLILSYLRIMLKQAMATKMAGRYKVVLEMA